MINDLVLFAVGIFAGLGFLAFLVAVFFLVAASRAIAADRRVSDPEPPTWVNGFDPVAAAEAITKQADQ